MSVPAYLQAPSCFDYIMPTRATHLSGGFLISFRVWYHGHSTFESPPKCNVELHRRSVKSSISLPNQEKTGSLRPEHSNDATTAFQYPIERQKDRLFTVPTNQLTPSSCCSSANPWPAPTHPPQRGRSHHRCLRTPQRNQWPTRASAWAAT
jgi:hypothetical protein